MLALYIVFFSILRCPVILLVYPTVPVTNLDTLSIVVQIVFMFHPKSFLCNPLLYMVFDRIIYYMDVR